jgi:hypothetical protein
LGFHYSTAKASCQALPRTPKKSNPYLVFFSVFFLTFNSVFRIFNSPKSEFLLLQDLYWELQGKIPNMYLLGDSRQAKNIMNAIWDAYEVARAI